VLMDCMMPEMDGYEATRQIRALASGRRIPILGLTANARQTELDRCIESGMDGYLTKPVDSVALASLLADHIPSHASPPPSLARGRCLTEDSAMQDAYPLRPEVLEGLKDLSQGDDDPFFTDLLTTFLTHAPERVASIGRALESQNAETVCTEAHTLKGSSGNLGAHQLQALCLKIESFGREGRLEAVHELLDALRLEWTRVQEAMERDWL